jgi:transposase InsO family protein
MNIDVRLAWVPIRSPWQNPYVERLIGTLRRECLDHVLIFGERHLHRILSSYSLYYNEARPHLGLGKDPPLPSER